MDTRAQTQALQAAADEMRSHMQTEIAWREELILRVNAENALLRRYLRDALANLDPATLGDYALWTKAANG